MLMNAVSSQSNLAKCQGQLCAGQSSQVAGVKPLKGSRVRSIDNRNCSRHFFWIKTRNIEHLRALGKRIFSKSYLDVGTERWLAWSRSSFDALHHICTMEQD